MGFSCFSRILKYASVALIGSTVAIVSILSLFSPVAAQNTPNGGGGQPMEKSWDTDNLRYGGIADGLSLIHI